jgi:hypothetical protein
MRFIIYSTLTFLYVLLLTLEGLCQCSSGCTWTVTSSNSTGYTIGAGQKLCIVANTSNVALSGTIKLGKSGAIEICSANNDTVSFTGSYTETSPGGGDRTFTVYGNFYYPGSWTPFRSFITNYGYIGTGGGFTPYYNLVNSGTIKVNGLMNIQGDVKLTNSGTITTTGGIQTAAGDTIVNTGTITSGASWVVNTSTILYNYNNINITGDLPFYGNYIQEGTVNVTGQLSFNAGSVGTISGGVFYSKDLLFDNARVNGGSSCAAFVASGTTNVNNSNFLATGNVNVTDLSTPGGLDHSVCPGSPAPANCGLTLSSSTASNSCLNTLPVSLISFEGKYLNESQIELKWSTAMETNNGSFLLERTEDFSSFQPIADINGSMNSKDINNYEFIDNYSLGQEVYYRLSQKDMNGSTSILGFVSPENFDSNLRVKVYPNPNKGQFTVNWAGKSLIRTIQLLDQTGKVVYSISEIESDQNNLTINLDGLSGIYILTITAEDQIIHNKIRVE